MFVEIYFTNTYTTRNYAYKKLLKELRQTLFHPNGKFNLSNNVLRIAFASLESLGQDKTFKSLESLVRLFPKVSKVIIFFFWMHKNG